jgi:hypothetical protein
MSNKHLHWAVVQGLQKKLNDALGEDSLGEEHSLGDSKNPNLA